MPNQDMKKVYDITEIQKFLGVGRSSAYKFLEKVFANQKPFTVIKIGKLYRIPKESFDQWINAGMKIDNDL